MTSAILHRTAGSYGVAVYSKQGSPVGDQEFGVAVLGLADEALHLLQVLHLRPVALHNLLFTGVSYQTIGVWGTGSDDGGLIHSTKAPKKKLAAVPLLLLSTNYE